ncbi:MAG: type IV conjugative transfer system protein TraL [Neisseriales bacterium]|jgi:type IV conjugative transfer system protein TraL|nr:MAG: type IV conjugative transfer system protein TraL [Neisseriales bacterium]
MSNKSYYIPKRLDDPPKALWFDADEIIVFAVILFPGIIMKKFMLFLLVFVIALFVTYQYTKIKAGKLRGFLIHFFYWNFGALKLKRLPPSHIREISG